MKRQYISFLMVIVGVCSACSIGEELVTAPKTKKKYVSEQHCVELEGENIVVTNNAYESSIALRQFINRLDCVIHASQKESLSVLSDYADGEKDCFLRQANKAERTDYYEKRMKCKRGLERCADEMHKMGRRLDALTEEIIHQFQSEYNTPLS